MSSISILRLFFWIVLLSMLAVTIWASLHVAIWRIPGSVLGHPWFIATLFDTYFAFFTFYCWLVYKERRWISRLLWLVAIICLGNIAMAIYMLIVLYRVPTTASVSDVLLRRPAQS